MNQSLERVSLFCNNNNKKIMVEDSRQEKGDDDVITKYLSTRSIHRKGTKSAPIHRSSPVSTIL